MTSRYFKILGVPYSATMAEIKSAYRKKAKLLHPDRNPSLDAHERFVELSEAYDFIVAYRSGVYSRAARKGRNDSPEKRRAQEAKQREQQPALHQEADLSGELCDPADHQVAECEVDSGLHRHGERHLEMMQVHRP